MWKRLQPFTQNALHMTKKAIADRKQKMTSTTGEESMVMDEKLYGYMNWPRIEAIVYGEETAPRDVMGPRITQDGVLVQGFFPDAEEVKIGRAHV